MDGTRTTAALMTTDSVDHDAGMGYQGQRNTARFRHSGMGGHVYQYESTYSLSSVSVSTIVTLSQ